MHIRLVPTSAGVIRLRHGEITARCDAAGLRSGYALARAMGVHHTTVTRVLSGACAPGAAVIAGLLRALPGSRFEDLFEITAPDEVAATCR